MTTNPLLNGPLDDLQEVQYADLYHVDDSPLADLRLKTLRQLGWWMVGLVLISLTLGYLIVLPDTIPTSFVFKSDQAEAIYRFPQAVYLERLYVKNGQRVKAGDVLLEISAPDIAALSHELASTQAKLSGFQQFRLQSASSEQALLAVTIQHDQQEIDLKKAQLLILDKKWAAETTKLLYERQEAKRLQTINLDLYRTGDISRNELNQVEANFLRAQSAYEMAYQTYLDQHGTLARQITALTLAIKGHALQVAKNTSDLQLEAHQLRTAQQMSRKKIEGIYGTFALTDNDHLRLIASCNGTVSFVFIGDKEVAAGTTLLKLMHKEDGLYAYTQVTSSQIGKIKVGQLAVFKVDAFPVYEWGPAYGLVSEVSLTPDEKGFFNVRLSLTDKGQLAPLLQIGLRGRADIVTDERTIYGYLFRKFKRAAAAMTT